MNRVTVRRHRVPVGGVRELALDVFPANQPSRRMAVILLHGGGWRFGSPDTMSGYADALAAAGFVAIAAEYRLLDEAPWPTQLDDVCAVVDWAVEQAADLAIDPSRVALQGFSAGGHLALLAAAHRPRVAAVVSLFAPAVMQSVPGHPFDPVIALLGPDAPSAVIASANPLDQVAEGFPPTFLLSGMDDPLISPDVALAFMERLRAVGTPVDLHLFHAHTHEFSALPSMIGEVQREVALFLDRAVVDPERYRRENLELNMFAQPSSISRAPRPISRRPR